MCVRQCDRVCLSVQTVAGRARATARGSVRRYPLLVWHLESPSDLRRATVGHAGIGMAVPRTLDVPPASPHGLTVQRPSTTQPCVCGNAVAFVRVCVCVCVCVSVCLSVRASRALLICYAASMLEFLASVAYARQASDWRSRLRVPYVCS